MKSSVSNYNCSFKKLVVMSKLVKNYTHLDAALLQLQFLPQKAAKILRSLITSAVANAKEPISKLKLQEIRLGRGKCYTRYMPRARGRTFNIRKIGVNIEVLLKEVNK